jgi:hypothetical protein
MDCLERRARCTKSGDHAVSIGEAALARAERVDHLRRSETLQRRTQTLIGRVVAPDPRRSAEMAVTAPADACSRWSPPP